MLCPGFVLKSASVTAQQNDRRLDARTLTRTVLELIAPCKASLSLSLTPVGVTVSAGQSFELNVLFSARDRLKAVCVSLWTEVIIGRVFHYAASKIVPHIASVPTYGSVRINMVSKRSGKPIIVRRGSLWI